MPSLITHRRGAVVRVNGPNATAALAFTIKLASVSQLGTQGAGMARAIITQAGINQAGNFQFMHTLNETIYAYVFGDRIGDLRVSGLAFAEPCGGGTGMHDILEAYRQNRLAVKGGPVIVSFGTDAADTFRSFLVGMALEVADPETKLGQWSFKFNTFPSN